MKDLARVYPRVTFFRDLIGGFPQQKRENAHFQTFSEILQLFTKNRNFGTKFPEKTGNFSGKLRKMGYPFSRSFSGISILAFPEFSHDLDQKMALRNS